MAVKYAKFIVLKSDVSGVLPTVPTVSDHYKSGWIQETDIYEGEFFLNTADQAVFTRCGDTIIQIAGTAFAQTLVSLHDVDVSGSPGIQDGDVLVYDSATQTWIPGPGGEIGLSGYSGAAGASGTSGYSGTAGESGTSGYSGAAGADGLDGISGASGYSGARGISGYSGAVGTSGYSGYEGTSGARGADGANTLRWNYGDKSWHYGEMIANDVNLASATVITLNEKDSGNVDRTNWNEAVKDWIDAGNTAIMMVSRPGSATDVGVYYIDSVTLVHTTTDYYSYGLTPITGYGSFELGEEYAVSWVLSGPRGVQGEQGISGYSGRTGASGASGYSGTSGTSGYSGVAGSAGASGASGKSGYSGATGPQGTSGYSGAQGIQGISGTSGKSGYSGYSGLWGGNSALLYLRSSALDPATPDVAGLTTAGDFGYRIHNPITNFSSEVYELYFRNDDQEGSDLSDWFDEMTASTSDVKGHIRLFKPNSSPLDYALFRVDSLIAAGSGPGTLRRIGVTYLGGTVSAGSSNFVLSFVRSGEPGTSGVSGYSGATGPQGTSGVSGYSGATGPQGTSGYSGAQGISGYSGAAGAAGDNLDFIQTVHATEKGIVYKDELLFLHDFNYGNNGTVTTAGQNTFLGLNSGNLTAGATATLAVHASYNTGIGYNTLNDVTLATSCTAVGSNCLPVLTIGHYNTAVGCSAGLVLAEGQYNTLVGYESAKALSGNSRENVMIGSCAGRSLTGASYNTYVGTNAGRNAQGGDNVAVGYDAYRSTDTASGTKNTAIGRASLYHISTGSNNVGVGYQAGTYTGASANVTTAANSVFVGYLSRALANGNTNEIVIGYNTIGGGSNTVTLGNDSITGTYLKGAVTLNDNLVLEATTYANQDGIIYKGADTFIHDFNYGNNGTVTTTGRNTFVGVLSGNLTMGATATDVDHSSYNTGIGYGALYANTDGYGNTAVGSNSMVANTEGINNTAIGMSALDSNTIGSGNTAIGRRSMHTNTEGIYNTAIGMSALYNADARDNVAVGYYASYAVSSGEGNTSLGTEALRRTNTGGYNTAIGMYSMYFNTNGTYNTAIGHRSGERTADGVTINTTSDYSTYIGTNTKAGASGNQNEIVIGYNAIGSGSNTATIGNTSQTLCKINGAVQVGDSSASPSADLVGAMRYRTSGSNSYFEMVMQTGASTYEWVVIKTNTW